LIRILRAIRRLGTGVVLVLRHRACIRVRRRFFAVHILVLVGVLVLVKVVIVQVFVLIGGVILILGLSLIATCGALSRLALSGSRLSPSGITQRKQNERQSADQGQADFLLTIHAISPLIDVKMARK
jgi:hypothetical protein